MLWIIYEKKNKQTNTNARCAGYTNILTVENARQPEQKTQTKPTVRLQHRRFLSISHEQTSAPGVSNKWGDVGRVGEKNGGEEEGVERKAVIVFHILPYPSLYFSALARSFVPFACF